MELTVSTDASLVAARFIVLVNFAGGKKPVTYYSKKYNDIELCYSTPDREMLAFIDCLRHFKHMLLGRTLQVFMDHRPLITYFSKGKALTAREARW